MNQLLTTRNVADALQVDVQTVIKYVNQKKLGSTLVGSSYRFTQEDIDRFLAAGRK